MEEPPMVLPDLPVSDTRTDDLVRLEPGTEGARLDLAAIFGNDRAVELEIGIGKGRFLLLAAAGRPETNFLGLEYSRKCVEKTIDRVGKRALTNVRVVHAEAVCFLAERLDEACLAAAHVYFPDPWPKKRHHKRRFFRSDALDQLARVLRPGALVRAATDHAEYAEVISDVVDRHPLFENLAPDVAGWDLAEMSEYIGPGVTNFEIKYLREGRTIHRFAWRRAGAGPPSVPLPRVGR